MRVGAALLSDWRNFSFVPPAAKLVKNGEVYERRVRGSPIGSRSPMIRSDEN